MISKKKIKILHFITGIDIGGAEMLLLNFLKNADKKEFDFTVVYLKGNSVLLNEFKKTGITIHPVPKIKRNYITRLLFIFKIMKNGEFDILHNHLIQSILFGRVLGWIAGIKKIISTEHNLTHWKLSHVPVHLFYRITCSIDKKIIAISEAVKQSLIEVRKIKPQKIKVIYNGIELDKFKPKEIRLSKFKNHFPVIGCINRLFKIKGQVYLIDAVDILRKKYPGIALVLVGDGPLKNELTNYSNKKGLSRQIYFEGIQTQIEDYLNSFDIFVLPSIDEGLSIALIEALASGRKIVATDIGGIPEVVEHMKEGILVPSRNSEALAKSIDRLILDVELSETLQKNALIKAEKRFNLNNMIKQLEDLYKELVYTL